MEGESGRERERERLELYTFKLVVVTLRKKNTHTNNQTNSSQVKTLRRKFIKLFKSMCNSSYTSRVLHTDTHTPVYYTTVTTSTVYENTHGLSGTNNP